MASNNNELTQSSGLYKPPHMRAGYVQYVSIKKSTLKNNITKYADKNLKFKKKRNVGNLNHEELFSNYIPSKQQVNYFGTSKYFDCKFKGSYIEYKEKIEKSTTLYVGNLNLVSTEVDIHKRLSEAGKIKNIIMGLDRNTLSFVGFCFVEYETRIEAENCKNNMQGTLLDGKKMFIDWDAGFIEGRQYKRLQEEDFF